MARASHLVLAISNGSRSLFGARIVLGFAPDLRCSFEMRLARPLGCSLVRWLVHVLWCSPLVRRALCFRCSRGRRLTRLLRCPLLAWLAPFFRYSHHPWLARLVWYSRSRRLALYLRYSQNPRLALMLRFAHLRRRALMLRCSPGTWLGHIRTTSQPSSRGRYQRSAGPGAPPRRWGAGCDGCARAE